MSDPHILIIGAGVTGLLLAQALKKHDIPYTVFERDAIHREQGWGLAFHWAFPTLQALIPDDLATDLARTYCIPTSTEAGEPGSFPFVDLRTGEVRWALPPGKRRRVVRRKLCRLLETDLKLARGHRLESITQNGDQTVTAHFEADRQVNGTHIVGCDGTNSTVRRLLCGLTGSAWKPEPLPVRFMGANVVLSGATGRRMQKLDRAFYQGGDAQNDSFTLFAIQDTPENNEREDGDSYLCQIVVSWPFRPGFLGRDEPTDLPEMMSDRVPLMREIAKEWTSPYRDIIFEVPQDTAIHPIVLQDWIPQKGAWDNLNGRAALIGDAAHPMTMYRGEAANHGVTDVESWLRCHLHELTGWKERKPQTSSCEDYENEMVKRAAPAVLASRQACLDAHNHQSGMNGESPLVSRRKVDV